MQQKNYTDILFSSLPHIEKIKTREPNKEKIKKKQKTSAITGS